MTEISAFNRRHHPRRHSVASSSLVDFDLHDQNQYEDVVLTTVRERLELEGVSEAPRSHSKTRKPAATIVMSVVGTSSHSSTSRKMSGTQLRVFFLLCASLYFAVICFADEIVRLGEWMGADDETHVWRSTIATPKPTVAETTPLPTNVAIDMTQGPSGTLTTAPKKGNLRGEKEDPKAVNDPIPEETPTPSAVEKEVVGTSEPPSMESTTEKPVALTPSPPHLEDKLTQTKEAVEQPTIEVTKEGLEKDVKPEDARDAPIEVENKGTEKEVIHEEARNAPLDRVDDKETITTDEKPTPETREPETASVRIPQTAAPPNAHENPSVVPEATQMEDGARNPDTDER